MSGSPVQAHKHWRMGPGIFAARPRLAIAFGLGVGVGVGCALFAPGLRPTACAITGWDTVCLAFMLLAWRGVAGDGPAEMRARAAQQDEGQAVILTLVLAACAASVVAIALELSLAKGEHGMARALHVAVAFVTVTISWLMMQTMFALHYAHEYYAADPTTGADRGGLIFPGGEPPDYWDFLHFSIVIGVASQTADVAFSDRGLRQLGTLHSLVAFAYNTLIVALTINLVAGLF